jgi:hypothetical protein
MAVKTFTSSTLSSADTNTYLANSGLVYVKSQTIGSAVTSVSVSDAFSATYDNYQVVVSGGVASGNIDFRFNFNGSTASYYGAIMYASFAGAAPATVGFNNIAYWFAGGQDASGLNVNMYINAPFLAKTSKFTSPMVTANTAGSTVFGSGFHNVASSYTGFTITAASGTFTGGTITVYGYRLG